MIKPLKAPSKTPPITFIGKKNQTIFTEVIPTLRKIQRKKHNIEVKKKIEINNKINKLLTKETRIIKRMVENRIIVTDPKTNKKKAMLFSEISPKLQKDITRFISLKLKKIDVTKITQEHREQLFADVRQLLFNVKVKKNSKILISKNTARKELIEDFSKNIAEYNKLKEKDQRQINTIINYNLSLLTKETYLTQEMYRELKEIVFFETSKLNVNYTAIEEIKTSVLNYKTTKKIFSQFSPLEKTQKIKHLEKLIRATPDYYTSKGRAKIERAFAREILGLNKK